jgi:hypothetical protein
MPDGIRTHLQRHQEDNADFAELTKNFPWKTPEQGASTSVLLATSPPLDGIGGRYFEDCNEALPNTGTPGPGRRAGRAPAGRRFGRGSQRTPGCPLALVGASRQFSVKGLLDGAMPRWHLAVFASGVAA